VGWGPEFSLGDVELSCLAGGIGEAGAGSASPPQEQARGEHLGFVSQNMNLVLEVAKEGTTDKMAKVRLCTVGLAEDTG
jgi:hypothetical protein